MGAVSSFRTPSTAFWLPLVMTIAAARRARVGEEESELVRHGSWVCAKCHSSCDEKSFDQKAMPWKFGKLVAHKICLVAVVSRARSFEWHDAKNVLSSTKPERLW
jgi:hypothetical protein